VVALVLFAGVNVAVDVWRCRMSGPSSSSGAAVSLVILLLPAVRRSFAAPAG
jgi:MYXO-CTERM domain-containing protein